jgi:hypothetical protein
LALLKSGNPDGDPVYSELILNRMVVDVTEVSQNKSQDRKGARGLPTAAADLFIFITKNGSARRAMASFILIFTLCVAAVYVRRAHNSSKRTADQVMLSSFRKFVVRTENNTFLLSNNLRK